MAGKLEDYNISITVPALIKDPALRGGHCVMNRNGSLRRYVGGFCVVYPFDVGRKRYAVRCWYNEVDNARFRAEEVSKILRKGNLPWFVEFEYVPQGLLTPDGIHPVVRMEWVEGDELKDYICKHKKDSSVLYRLAGEFRRMVATLHSCRLSHGDLQHGNIKVKNDGHIVLVDYDSLYHPSMGRMADCILGRPEYQHPLRAVNRNASEHVDYFSEIVIYTSLLYFAANPDAYTDEIHDSEGLIFAPADYLTANMADSGGYRALCDYSRETRFLARKIAETCRNARTLETVPPLESILTEGEQTGMNFDCVQVCADVEKKRRWERLEKRLKELRKKQWQARLQKYSKKQAELTARRCSLAARQQKTAAALRRGKWRIAAVTIIAVILSASGCTFNRYFEAKQSWQTCMTAGDGLLQHGNYAEALSAYRSALSVPFMKDREKTVELKIQDVNAAINAEASRLLQELPPLLGAYKVIESQHLKTEITRRISRIREIQPDNKEIGNPKYKPFI
ncbi:MAG: hypothetical protein LBS42_01370 [Tannerella sp.]|jgi:serine/threonine protein kinase|nr:hypothetical protein [Tannerella sp.]